MRHYEMMMILDPEVEERTITATLDKLLAVIATDGGTVDNIDVWGRRRMSFDINKKSEGLYAVVDFSASSDTAKELDRQLSLNELVLRTKIMRKDESYAQRNAE
jgi:small subunit ribosomal protein S6